MPPVSKPQTDTIMFCPQMPVNPRPFAEELAASLKVLDPEDHSYAYRCKRIAWMLLAILGHQLRHFDVAAMQERLRESGLLGRHPTLPAALTAINGKSLSRPTPDAIDLLNEVVPWVIVELWDDRKEIDMMEEYVVLTKQYEEEFGIDPLRHFK